MVKIEWTIILKSELLFLFDADNLSFLDKEFQDYVFRVQCTERELECFKSAYDRRNSEHKQSARTNTHVLEQIINIKYRNGIRRSRRYLGSRCIVSFRSDVKFHVEFPGGLGDITLQPCVPVMTRPPGDVSRHQ